MDNGNLTTDATLVGRLESSMVSGIDTINVNEIEQEISGHTANIEVTYDMLPDKPSINDTELTGELSLDDLGIDQNFVKDNDYVHTDNNYTNEEKTKLSGLNNYDDTEIKSNISSLQTNKADRSEIPDVSQFITKSVNDLTNYYLKNETYTKAEVNNLISAIKTATFEVVNELPVTGKDNIMYLVPSFNPKTQNVKDEYIWVNNAWEQIGNTEIDLSNYITTTQLNTALSNYTTTTDLTTLLNGKQNTLVSGTNIKTINNESILGEGNINISGGGVTYTAGTNIQISSENVISATDTTYNNATTEAAGLMSSNDKIKLNEIENGAEVNVQSDWNETDTNSDSYIQNKPTIPDELADLQDDSTHRLVTDVEKTTWNSKANTSDIPTKTSDLTNDSGFLTSYTETDPIFTTSASAGITSNDISNWNSKQSALTFDSTPTQNSTNPVTSGGVYNALQNAVGDISTVLSSLVTVGGGS